MAILLVVAFHVQLPKLGGGFVGVDVFFVISGYLITRNLIHEVDGARRVALVAFWGKRLRRLVPALGLVTVVTLVASALVLPLFRWGDVALQGGAAALYLSNLLFARQSEDYFAADVDESPFLHTWSLGVEEQFYLVWPLLFAVVALLVRRHPDRLRQVLAGAFGLTFVLSLAASVVLTPREPAWAFYLLPTRAWEFATAGLLALVVLPSWWGRPAVRWAAAVTGAVLVVGAGFELSSATAYPGTWAAVPVLGTVLLMASGDPGPGGATILPSRLLSLAPVQWLGRVSYSWYLWHWPAIVLTIAALDDDRPVVRAAAATASLGVAHLTYRYFENPVRFSPWLTRSDARTIGLALGATVLVVGLAAGVAQLAEHRKAGSSLEARLARARHAVKPDDCTVDQTSPSGVEYCLGGRLDADRTVLLVGDSHAGHWVRAMEVAADEASVRLAYRWRGACPALDVRVSSGGDTDRIDPDCDAHRSGTRQLVEELRPDLVVVASSNEYESRLRTPEGERVPRDELATVWRASLERFVDGLAELDVPVAVVIDNASMRDDPNVCIAHRGDPEACAPSLEDSLHRSREIRGSERAVVAERGLASLDVNPVICDDLRCALEVDGTLVYADRGHLNVEFTMTMVPRATDMLTEGLAASAR